MEGGDAAASKLAAAAGEAGDDVGDAVMGCQLLARTARGLPPLLPARLVLAAAAGAAARSGRAACAQAKGEAAPLPGGSQLNERSGASITPLLALPRLDLGAGAASPAAAANGEGASLPWACSDWALPAGCC